MILLLKVVHSAIFFSLVFSLAVFSWGAWRGRPTRLTWIALAIITLEVAVVAACGGECPLTILAEQLGAQSGSVVDLFLPAWLAKRAFAIGGATFLTSLFVLAVRLSSNARAEVAIAEFTETWGGRNKLAS